MHSASLLMVGAISIASLWTAYSQVCTVCSFLHTTLPPIEFLDDFPRAKAAYKVSIYVIGYVGLNARSTVYRSISTDGGSKVSDAVKNGSPASKP
jgi:hypothetical protein